jgi:4-hydroxy-tetrahydrodipicolinate reductase
VILWGLGALGSRALQALTEGVQDVTVVGAVDNATALAGRAIGDAFPAARGLNLTIVPDLDRCLADLAQPADVVFHMTESVLPTIQSQLEHALSSRLNVISAAESMFHPSLRHPEIARQLDAVARINGVSITGCGINPGFVADSLVLAGARVSTSIRTVSVHRVIDVTGTGPHDIDHVGFGLWPQEFDEKIASGRVVGHMGMPESIAAVAEHVGLPVDRITQRWETATADFTVESTVGLLEPGRVIGISQFGTGFVGEREAIQMRLTMFYDPPRHGLAEVDEVVIEGSHRVHLITQPAAVSIQGAGLMIINAARDIVEAEPGLHSILSFSMGGAFRGGFRLVADPQRPGVPNSVWLTPISASRPPWERP